MKNSELAATTNKEALSRAGAVAIAAIAALQWWLLAGRATHIARMYWKDQDYTVTASVFGLCLFLACSLGGLGLGATVTRICHRQAWPFYVARLSTVAIAIGTIVWPAMIMSPAVRLVAR